MSYSEQTAKGLQCRLCPNNCLLQQGKTGICQVRKNERGLTLPFSGIISSSGIDPIEKKPLYHFYPNSEIFSIGFLGCSLRCPFCQNYSISQYTDRGGEYMSPGNLLTLLKQRKLMQLAYTYNEPTIHFEYLMESASLVKKEGIRTVLVTNGYMNPEPAKELLSLIDAVNVDLKSFQSDFYRNELKGKLEPVLEFIRLAVQHCHVEVTTLIIPGKNDSHDEMKKIASFLAALNPELPLHLSCYHPNFKYDVPATNPEHLFALMDTAREYLHYVYPGNIVGQSNTLCPECGTLLIRRRGYQVDIENMIDGCCVSCHTRIPIIGK